MKATYPETDSSVPIVIDVGRLLDVPKCLIPGIFCSCGLVGQPKTLGPEKPTCSPVELSMHKLAVSARQWTFVVSTS